jgi:hypothetical protein
VWQLPGSARERAEAALVAGALAFAYARTLAPGITWANGGADSGDLVAAAATMGVAHPSGYPTYLLLARLFLLLPAGDLAWRATLLSATAGVLAALVVYAIVRRLCAIAGSPTAGAPAIAALAFGLAPLPWSQAVIAEVYSLNALFSALALLFLTDTLAPHPAYQIRLTNGVEAFAGGNTYPARASAPELATNRSIQPDLVSDPRRGGPRALLLGLALGNHLTIGLLAGAWLATDLRCARGWARLRRGAGRLGWLGAGLLVYLYLPLRAAAQPPINWGGASDWAGFWWVVSGQPYRALAFGLPPSFAYARAAAWAGLLIQQFGWAGVGLGLLGLFYGGAGARAFVWAGALLAAAYSIFAIAYNTADSYAYLLPVYLIFAIWIGLGAAVLLGWAGRWHALAIPAVALALALALIGRAPATSRTVDASADERAIAYGRAALAAAPIGAIVISAADRDTFPLWYYHYALGQRADLAVIVEPLLDFDWYRQNLRAVYPGLRIPDAPGTEWAAALAAANPSRGPICRTDIEARPPLLCKPE